jgi:hypothetical protein
METTEGNVKKRKIVTLAKKAQLDATVFQLFVQKRSQGILLSGPIITEKAIELNRKLCGDPSL